MESHHNVMDRTRAGEIVSWTLTFIQEDLSNIDATDKIKLSADLMKYLYLDSMTSETAQNEDTVRIFISNINLKKIQKALQDTFTKHYRPLIEGKEWFSRPPAKRETRDIVVKGILDTAFVVNTKLDDENIAVNNFCRAIDSLKPIPVSAFRICEGCKKYFFPTGKGSQQTRRFCTRSCNARHNAELRRKKDPEVYKEKQRKIMKKRYAEKKKKNQGAA